MIIKISPDVDGVDDEAEASPPVMLDDALEDKEMLLGPVPRLGSNLQLGHVREDDVLHFGKHKTIEKACWPFFGMQESIRFKRHWISSLEGLN